MATPTSAPPVRSLTRVSLEPGLARSLPTKQLLFAGWVALMMGLAGLAGLTPGYLDLVVGIGLGGAVALALPASPLRRLGALLAVPAVTGGVGAAVGSSSTLVSLGMQEAVGGYSGGIQGLQLLVAGGTAGVAAVVLGAPGFDRFHALAGLLAGVALAGLGWWVSQRLTALAPLTALTAAAQGTILGLVSGQVLLLPGLRSRSTTRIPNPSRIRATLTDGYREPCMEAWSFDQQVASEAPDIETRDGLGEVAAWIYRLQWTLQAMDGQLETQDILDVQERIAQLTAEAESTEDHFVRDRRLATARHLEQLKGHLEELTRERARTEALREYASAFLEEARTGLALARVQPGSHAPDRLRDVLGRLRSYSDEREARRRTAHEVVALA